MLMLVNRLQLTKILNYAANLKRIETILLSTTTVRTMSAKLNYPKNLSDFGYAFNDDGILKKIDKNTGKPGNEGFQFESQEHYEALGETITDEVYKLLSKNGLHKLQIPKNLPDEESTFIFSNKKDLNNSNKLIVLIHGSGVVRAGQWARSLIINQSINHGTQIPYVNSALRLGYDILLTNTNDNYRIVNNVTKSIPGNKSPVEHACSVWDDYVIPMNPKSVAIVAHSYGGVVTLELLKKYTEFFRKKVFAIGFTDSVHSTSHLSESDKKYLHNIGRNWVTSSKPLDELVRNSSNDLPQYSAGHTKHEWTSYACMDALFNFFEQKYKDFQLDNNQNKSKLEL